MSLNSRKSLSNVRDTTLRVDNNSPKKRVATDSRYAAMVNRPLTDVSEVLRFSKALVADPQRFQNLVGADSSISFSDEGWINADTKEVLPTPTPSNTCGDGNDCGQFFQACLSAKTAQDAEKAADECMAWIAKEHAGFFTKMNTDVHRMHPSSAVSFLQSLGFRGRRVNFMDAFETVDSWTRNLSVMLNCKETSKEVCNILNNLKLMEYIRSVWEHVHNNPAILNGNGDFAGTHDTTADGCCDTVGFNIHKKKNVPGNRVSINRLLYKIKRDNRLRFAMLGIPTQLLHVNVLTGMHGGSANLLNEMKPYNLQTGGNVVNEFLKMTPTAARRLSEIVDLTVKTIKKHLKSPNDAAVLNDVKQAHENLKERLTKLSDSERKMRQLTVAWSVLADKVALSGKDIIPDDLSGALENVYSAIQRYNVKAATRVRNIESEANKLLEKDEIKEALKKEELNLQNAISSSQADEESKNSK